MIDQKIEQGVMEFYNPRKKIEYQIQEEEPVSNLAHGDTVFFIDKDGFVGVVPKIDTARKFRKKSTPIYNARIRGKKILICEVLDKEKLDKRG